MICVTNCTICQVKEETKIIHDKVEEVLGVVKDKLPGLKETRPAKESKEVHPTKTHNANSAMKASRKTTQSNMDRFVEKEIVSSIPSDLIPPKQSNINSFPYQLGHMKAHQFLSFTLRQLLGTFFTPILRGPHLSLSWINGIFLLRLIAALLLHSVLLGNMDVIPVIQTIFIYH